MTARTTRLRLWDACVLLFCAAILCGTFGAVGDNGRGRAKEAVCLANLHKWGGIFQAYLDDHNGYFMEGESGLPDGGSNRWVEALSPYHEYNERFMCCPEATVPEVELDGSSNTGPHRFGSEFAWGYTSTPEWPRPMKGSYSINGWCSNPAPGQGPFSYPADSYWRTSEVEGAAAIPVLVGALQVHIRPRHYDCPPVYDWAPRMPRSDEMEFACVNRHGGTVGCLFMDWSARKVGLKELWTLKWHRKFDTSGPWTTAGGVTRSDWPLWMREFKVY